MTDLKTCPTCGTEYEPEERICPRDGSALRARGDRANGAPPGQESVAAHRPSLEITQFTPIYRSGSRRRAVRALIAAGVLAVIGAGAVYARREPVPAPAPATATVAAAPTPPPSAGTASASEAELESAVARDWAGYVGGITAGNAADRLALAERLLARPRLDDSLRLRAMLVQATSFAELGRGDERCATLRGLRDARAFGRMDADFRQTVAQFFVAQRGPCQ